MEIALSIGSVVKCKFISFDKNCLLVGTILLKKTMKIIKEALKLLSNGSNRFNFNVLDNEETHMPFFDVLSQVCVHEDDCTPIRENKKCNVESNACSICRNTYKAIKFEE